MQWDKLFGSIYTKDISALKKMEDGERTRERFATIEKPDYSVLLSPSFWLHAQSAKGVKKRA